jgi:3-oxoacyl-[acyl-carrier-protein] synthase-1
MIDFMQQPVCVTGMGIISSIGISTDETLTALKNRCSGMGYITRFDTVHRDIPVCEVKYDNGELADMLHIPGNRKGYTRTALLGMIAARQAMQSSHSNIPEERIALVSATTVGGMDYNEIHYKDLSAGKGDRKAMELLDCADATQKIAADLAISSRVTTVSTACSSSANAIIAGARMIRNGLADKVLVGGTDALTRFALNGFNSLEIVSPTGCRPFDANRNGVTLGEGAACLVLESPATVCPEDILCILSGSANTNEAYHQTASSPDGNGAALAMSCALASAGLKASDIDCINAHGTGTPVNDLSEGRAIETVFGDNIPAVASTKGYTGHTLAAAGAIEAVISILAIRHQLAFPNIRFSEQMPELSFSPDISLKSIPLRHVLSNSLGFGGSNSSLVFSKY